MAKRKKNDCSTKGSKEKTPEGIYDHIRAWKTKTGQKASYNRWYPVDEFIRQNADPIWLHQNEMWEYIEQP